MRNNPEHGADLEFKDLFKEYARQEKLRRFFTLKRQKIFKHFNQQPYHTNFTYDCVPKYLEALDELLFQKGAIVRNFDVELNIEQPEEASDRSYGFDPFYEALIKWAVQ